MLLDLVSTHPFEVPRFERLRHLEKVLRRSSESAMTLDEYSELLREAGIRLPTERTLYEDLSRYSRFCDDLLYGQRARTLSIDTTASRDAVAWMLGVPWLQSPLQPNLSSARLRCLLLAMQQGAEVRFQYRPLRKPGEPWSPTILEGVPVRTIPGIDSGYIQIHSKEGVLVNLNLARLEDSPVYFTGVDASAYPPLPAENAVEIIIADEDVQLQERLIKQFNGLKKKNGKAIVMVVDESLAVMTLDILTSHLQRTVVEERTLKTSQQIGNTYIRCVKPKEPEAC